MYQVQEGFCLFSFIHSKIFVALVIKVLLHCPVALRQMPFTVCEKCGLLVACVAGGIFRASSFHSTSLLLSLSQVEVGFSSAPPPHVVAPTPEKLRILILPATQVRLHVVYKWKKWEMLCFCFSSLILFHTGFVQGDDKVTFLHVFHWERIDTDC